MEPWSVPFIGREEELATIERHLQAWGERYLLFVHGEEGGIGKTRLLHQIEEQFATLAPSHPLMFISIIDFDDGRYTLPQAIGLTIARQMNSEADEFAPYFDALRELHIAEERAGDEKVPIVQRKLLAVNRFFKECFNRVSQQQRVVIRLDTTETPEAAIPLAYLFDLTADLHNVLIIAAGRNGAQLYAQYGQARGDEASLISLPPFSLNDSRAYLLNKQKILKVTLDQEWMEKLFILVGGIPVLIDLTIEWAQVHQMGWVDEQVLSELETLAEQSSAGDTMAQAELKKRREQFKQELVLPLADLRTYLDHLVVLLAKVYPLDLEGMVELLGFDQEKVEQLMGEALRSVAIKRLPDGRIKLHDEVQRLVRQHVWPIVDPKRDWELRDNKRAVAYLSRKSDLLFDQVQALKERERELLELADPAEGLRVFGQRREKESELWTLRIERLRRQLTIDVQEGYSLFESESTLARRFASGAAYREGFLAVIQPYADLQTPLKDIEGNTLTEEQQLEIQRRVAREATYNGKYELAASIYQQLLEKVPQDSEQYIDILIGQSNQLVRIGKIREALTIQEQRSLKLAQQLGSKPFEIKSKLVIGWIHRLSWSLDRALQSYDEALRDAYAIDDEERIALICSSRAYVQALKQDRSALEEVQQAIRLWQQLWRERAEYRFGLGQCYNTAGEICLELGRPEEALSYFNLSWESFINEEVSTTIAEWKSKCRSGRGFAYWQWAENALRKGNEQAAQVYLQQAQEDLEWASERRSPVDGPGILNRLGEVYFLLREYEQARKKWEKGVQEAQHIKDAFAELQCKGNLARLSLYYPLEEYPTWRDFEEWYKYTYRPRSQTFYQPFLVALFYTYLGHLALKAEQIPDAVQFYERGLPLLAQNSSFSPFNVVGQFALIDTDILPLISSSSVYSIGEEMKKKWLEGGLDLAFLPYFKEWMRRATQLTTPSEAKHA